MYNCNWRKENKRKIWKGINEVRKMEIQRFTFAQNLRGPEVDLEEWNWGLVEAVFLAATELWYDEGVWGCSK